MRRANITFLIFCLLFLAYGVYAVQAWRHTPSPASPSHAATSTAAVTPTATSTIGQPRTKNTDCAMGTRPDPACTPGDVFIAATADQVCQSGYSQTVRNVSTQTKNKVYLEYGIYQHTTGQYEVDHFIPLELGGSNDVSNLWPEPASPKPGFHEKDEVENYLHDEVCAGRMSLSDAQRRMAADWLKVYNGIVKH